MFWSNESLGGCGWVIMHLVARDTTSDRKLHRGWKRLTGVGGENKWFLFGIRYEG
jgi:hypothetical protein